MVDFDPNFKQSRIDVLYVYERLEDIYKVAPSKKLKEFMDECDYNFKVDTGLTIKQAQSMFD